MRVDSVSAEVPADLREHVAGLDSVEKPVRDASMRALGQLRAFESIHVLVSALFDDDPAVSRWAATTLGLRGDSRALQPLLDRLGASDAQIREAAASALGLLGIDEASDDLVAALSDPDAVVGRAAAIALTRLGDDRGLRAAWDGLVSQLREGDAEERAFAARTLGALGTGGACDELVHALQDPSPDVRADVAEALGKIADKRAMPALLEAGFQDSDATVRDTAMFALSRMTGPPRTPRFA